MPRRNVTSLSPFEEGLDSALPCDLAESTCHYTKDYPLTTGDVENPASISLVSSGFLVVILAGTHSLTGVAAALDSLEQLPGPYIDGNSFGAKGDLIVGVGVLGEMCATSDRHHHFQACMCSCD